MQRARALVLAARLDRLDLGPHLGRYLLGSHGVGVVVVVGDAHRSWSNGRRRQWNTAVVA